MNRGEHCMFTNFSDLNHKSLPAMYPSVCEANRESPRFGADRGADIIRQDYFPQNDANRAQKRQSCLGDYAKMRLFLYKMMTLSTIDRHRQCLPLCRASARYRGSGSLASRRG